MRPSSLRAPADLVLGLLRHGYRAVELDRRQRGGGRTYVSRMLGRRAVVLGTEDAARLFYDESVVERAGAFPGALKNLLFGRGAVHGLDGHAHRSRKSLMRELAADTGPLVAEVGRRLEATGAAREGRDLDDPFAELVDCYGGAALEWSGCAPSADEERWMARELSLILDGFGSAGPAYGRAWAARRRTQRWLRQRILEVRAGERHPPASSPLDVLARRGDLSASVAAVELGNLVRPTVAVAWLAAFAAMRLQQFPEWRDVLASDEVRAEHVAFAHEVRRSSPFVPVLAGRARRGATVEGVTVRRGDRLVLDVWGIDTDPARWTEGEFHPDRFWRRRPEPFEILPQGGGDVTGHRCPGEDLAVLLLAETSRVLAHRAPRTTTLGLDLSRIPTRPR